MSGRHLVRRILSSVLLTRGRWLLLSPVGNLSTLRWIRYVAQPPALVYLSFILNGSWSDLLVLKRFQILWLMGVFEMALVPSILFIEIILEYNSCIYIYIYIYIGLQLFADMMSIIRVSPDNL